MPITVSWKDLLASQATSSQPPIARSSQNTQPTSMSMTLSTGQAFMTPYKHTRMNWQDLQKEKAIQKRQMKKKEQSEKTSKSPRSKHPDLRVVHTLNEIFGTLLGEVETMDKQKTE